MLALSAAFLLTGREFQRRHLTPSAESALSGLALDATSEEDEI